MAVYDAKIYQQLPEAVDGVKKLEEKFMKLADKLSAAVALNWRQKVPNLHEAMTSVLSLKKSLGKLIAPGLHDFGSFFASTSGNSLTFSACQTPSCKGPALNPKP